MLQALWPVPGLQDAQKRDNVLAGRIPKHLGLFAESLQHGGFDERDDFGGAAHDEPGIVLEEVSSDRPDPILLLGHAGEDVSQVRDVIGHSGEVVQFLDASLAKLL